MSELLTEGERKLATIRRIKARQAIEGADNIEVVLVDGWQVVAKKGEFQERDLCVYFEIDSFLPVTEQFEFLRKSCFRTVPGLGAGFRLKTIKLRGQLSQGLALPLASLTADFSGMPEGADVTRLLGVQKYEAPPPPEPNGPCVPKGSFPAFLRKTDQERLQNCFDHLKGDPAKYGALRYEVTLKLDGSSMSVYLNGGQFGVCSRNIELAPVDANSFWQAVRTHRLEERMRAIGGNFALQGELMGPGVQGNRERLPTYTFYLFDAFDIDARRLLLPAERAELLARLNAVDAGIAPVRHCPVLDTGAALDMFATIQDALAYADRPSMVHPIAEGVVFKSTERNLSFKIINNKFLLKCET